MTLLTIIVGFIFVVMAGVQAWTYVYNVWNPESAKKPIGNYTKNYEGIVTELDQRQVQARRANKIGVTFALQENQVKLDAAENLTKAQEGYLAKFEQEIEDDRG